MRRACGWSVWIVGALVMYARTTSRPDKTAVVQARSGSIISVGPAWTTASAWQMRSLGVIASRSSSECVREPSVQSDRSSPVSPVQCVREPCSRNYCYQRLQAIGRTLQWRRSSRVSRQAALNRFPSPVAFYAALLSLRCPQTNMSSRSRSVTNWNLITLLYCRRLLVACWRRASTISCLVLGNSIKTCTADCDAFELDRLRWCCNEQDCITVHDNASDTLSQRSL